MIIITCLIMGIINKIQNNFQIHKNINRIVIIGIIWSLIICSHNLFFQWQWLYNNPIELLNSEFAWTKYKGIIEIIIYSIAIKWIKKGYIKKGNIEKLFSVWSVSILIYINIINNYIGLLIAIEGQSLIMYYLAGIEGREGKGRERISEGIKYFMFGSLGSVLIIMGIAINNTNNYELISDLLIVTGIGIKLGIAPFHSWNIEVISNNPYEITAWFSTIGKIGLIVAFGSVINSIDVEAIKLISVFLLFSIILGALIGITERRIKRIIAYSGLLNLSFIMIGLIGSEGRITEEITYYIIQYIIAISIIIKIMEKEKIEFLTQIYSKFSCVRKSTQFLLLFLNSLSLAGFPPLAGFIAKIGVIKPFLSSGIGGNYGIGVISMIITVISFFIYLGLFSISWPSPQSPTNNLNNLVAIEENNDDKYPKYPKYPAWFLSFGTLGSIGGIIEFILY